MINPYAIGKSIYLRAPTLEDATDSSWFEWFSDPKITQYLGGSSFWPNTREMQIQFYEEAKKNKNRMVLLICLIETNELIGVCNLSEINWVYRYADVALVIAEEKYRKGTVAIETLALLLDIAFNRLNLLNLRASHIETNYVTPVLLKLFKFKNVGRYLKINYYFGEYVDTLLYQLSRKEWIEKNKK